MKYILDNFLNAYLYFFFFIDKRDQQDSQYFPSLSDYDSEATTLLSESEDESEMASQETYYSEPEQDETEDDEPMPVTPKKLSDPNWKSYSMEEKRKFLDPALQAVNITEGVMDSFLMSKRVALMKDLERETAKVPSAPKKTARPIKKPKKLTVAALRRMEKNKKAAVELRAKKSMEKSASELKQEIKNEDDIADEQEAGPSVKKTLKPKKPAAKKLKMSNDEGDDSKDTEEEPSKKKTKFVAHIADTTTIDLSENTKIKFKHIILGDGYYLRTNFVEGKKPNGERFKFTAIILGREQASKGRKKFEMTLPIKYGPKMHKAIGVLLAEDGKEYVPQ